MTPLSVEMMPPQPELVKPERLLPPLELEVMKVLWVLGQATVGQVQLEMRPTRPLAYTTVMTLLDRLARKGAVTRRKQGRGYLYEVALSRQVALERALDRFVHDFFGGSRERLMVYLRAGSAPNSPEAAEAVKPLESALL